MVHQDRSDGAAPQGDPRERSGVFDARALLIVPVMVAAALSACGGASRDEGQSRRDASPGLDGGAGDVEEEPDATSSVDVGADGGGEGVDASSRANGSVSVWGAATPMPIPRANHCSAVIGDRLVVIGGSYRSSTTGSFVATASVHVAEVRGDGSLGAWIEAGSMPSPVTECTAVASGSRLIVIDGIYENPTDAERILAAELDAENRLGPWSDLGSVPEGERVLSSEAWVYGGALFLVDTRLPDAGDDTRLHRAELSGAPFVFTTSAPITGFRAQAQYAFDGRSLLVIGGYLGANAGNRVVTDVLTTLVSADGSIVSPRETEPAPEPTAFGEAVVVDDYVFLVGGKDQIFGVGHPAVYSARILATGDLGPWSAPTPLPEGRTNHETVLVRDHLFVLGGGRDGPGLDTVFAARVRFP